MKSSLVTVETLQAFADAWNRHDIDALMSFMTDDCVFEASLGAESCGARFVGAEEVRRGFAMAWQAFPDAEWIDARHFVQGERGVSAWIFRGTGRAGRRVEVDGCDIFHFEGAKIAKKNSFRKNRQ